MPKSYRRNRDFRQSQRDTDDISSRRLLDYLLAAIPSDTGHVLRDSEQEKPKEEVVQKNKDRRRFDAGVVKKHVGNDATFRNVRLASPALFIRAEERTPKEVCKARTIRREIIFALRKAGSGSGSKKKHYNNDSRVKC